MYLINEDWTLNLKERLYDIDRALRRSPFGLWEFDSRCERFYWSDEVFNIFAKHPKSFKPSYENVIDCVHPDDRASVRAFFSTFLQGGEINSSCELNYRIIDEVTNQEHWVYQKVFRVIDKQDNAQYKFSGIIQDISENENLIEKYTKFYHVVKFAPNPFVIMNKSCEINYINKKCEKFYGYTLGELQGQSIRILNADKSVYLDNGYTESQYQNLFAKIEADLLYQKEGFWEGVLISQTKKGEVKWLLVFISSLKDMDGEKDSFVITGFDISEERKEEELIRIDTYNAIASLAEYRDSETGKHMKRIGEYCYLLARKLGKSRKFCDDIRIFAPMHDIGKVGIPDEILRAPRSLTLEEFEIMRTHTDLGYNILKNRSTLELAAEIAKNHHEKYDGSGYPEGLSGPDIPLSARICAVADVYDSLRSKRPYKEAFSEARTIQYLREHSGTHFEPMLVELLIKHRISFNAIYEKLKD
ncbi:MAG: HD domain-containing protein [Spirochaetales bacterium]|nr:HD domain-containing protein [Spirochaetales bacterium]